MGDMSAAVQAAAGGQSNFLVPNGTFFVVLIIFLIVLGIIGTFVVPPVSKVLGEREAMITKTAEDNRKSAERSAAAESEYRKAMSDARGAASGIRDQARAQGREIVEDMRARAGAESAAVLRSADEELTRQGQATTAELQTSVQSLSVTLADRILGVSAVSPAAASAQGR
jgi:F-type H+-transporting ATPase subunit b